MEKKPGELKKETITAIESAISNLTASDWDLETCRKLCCPERGEGGPATEDSFFFEEDLLSRLRLVEKGLIGMSESMQPGGSHFWIGGRMRRLFCRRTLNDSRLTKEVMKMEKKLKGFKDYADYQSCARVFLSWMSEEEHEKTYAVLLEQQEHIDPIRLMRQISAETYAKSLSRLALSSHG